MGHEELPILAPPEAVATKIDPVLELQQYVQKTRGKRRRVSVWKAWGWGAMIVFYPLLPFFLLWKVISRGIWNHVVGYSRRQKFRQLLSQVEQQQEVMAVGPILWLLKYDNLYLQRELTQALYTLLPLLKHPEELQGEEREAFTSFMRFSKDVRLVSLLLEAVERMGDRSPLCLYAVRDLSNRPYPSVNPLREKAKALLPQLEAQEVALRHHSELLRGSQAPPVNSNQLLRAAFENPNRTDPEMLLRPSASEVAQPTPLSEVTQPTPLLESTVLCESTEPTEILPLSSQS